MDIEKTFKFLVDDYNLNYACQEFNDCYGGNWTIATHSYYNQTGCFTIQFLYQRSELGFYYSKAYSSKLKCLCEKRIDEQAACPEIWFEAKKRFFFACRPQLYLNTLAQVIKQQIKDTNSFFGVSISI